MAAIPGMERWKGRTALVTGASVGIGYAVAKQLTEQGMNVFGCARNIANIEALSSELSSAPGKLVAIRCDVTKEEEILDMFAKIQAQTGGVDVCVNNAGLAHEAPLISGDTSAWRNMVEVNIIGLCVCTREFIKQLQQRGVDDGHVFHLNSMSGHRVVPSAGTHFYSATKFAVTALTEGLRQELRELKSEIKVTAISPGLVRTEFRGRLLKSDNIEQAKKDYDELVKGVLEAEDIASALVYALSTPPRVEIHDVLVRPTNQVT